MAAAGSDHHVAILLEDDVGAVVEVEHGDGVELGGGAARLRDRLWVDEMDLGGGGGRGEGQGYGKFITHTHQPPPTPVPPASHSDEADTIAAET